jgi:peptide/nickel transport system ATP-binding protein
MNQDLAMQNRAPALFEVNDLSVRFHTRLGQVAVLDHIHLDVAAGETVAVVGESGSGKSVMAFAALGILDPAGEVSSGSVRFDGQDLLQLPRNKLDDLRGRDLAMIFQAPRTALNPIMPVGKQIEDVLARHSDLSRRDRRDAAVEQLASVKITDPAKRYHSYPFELSGGMCQRVMIAIALACKPRLLIADEPTTGLDVTTQVVIMDLIAELADAQGMATLLITHDLGLASDYCARIAVMHAGQILETGSASVLLKSPRHPYTARLLAATPRPGATLASLTPIAGQLPDLRQPQAPCRFSARCERMQPACAEPGLRLTPITGRPEHQLACRNPL